MSEKKPILPKTRRKPKPAADHTAKFQAVLQHAPPQARYELLLYVTGNTPRSAQAIATVRSLCAEYLPGRHSLEVVDLYQQPARASDEQIIAAPTLVKRLPRPPKRLIGDLSDRARLLVGLNLVPAGAAPAPDGLRWLKL